MELAQQSLEKIVAGVPILCSATCLHESCHTMSPCDTALAASCCDVTAGEKKRQQLVSDQKQHAADIAETRARAQELADTKAAKVGNSTGVFLMPCTLPSIIL